MPESMRRQEIVAEQREAAGLPALRCPVCGKRAAHWEPDQLDDYGRVVLGYFTCDDGAA